MNDKLRKARQILDMARAGVLVPDYQIRWALIVSGDWDGQS